MTETEWLSIDDPQAMLEHARGQLSDRKLRLFACGCCRQVWHLLTDERSQKAVKIAEEYADGRINNAVLAAAWDAAWTAASAAARDAARTAAWDAAWTAASAAARDAAWTAARDAAKDAARAVARAAVWDAVWAAQAALLRCIVGNQFQPARQARQSRALDGISAPGLIGSLWVVDAYLVRTLAESVYEKRRPDGTLEPLGLAVLADALEEAGCEQAPLLEHLRSPGPHVRGCWALDLVLGKE